MTTTKTIPKLLFVTIIGSAFFMTQSAAAFCTWGIFPPEREYQPVDATEAFLSYEAGVQTLVLQPEWQGDVTDFAIIYPTPSKPEVTKGPTDLFWQLEEATNPFVVMPMAAVVDFAESDDEDAAERTVTVVEEKQVGEYDVTVLTATDADDLVEWLEDNDYNQTAEDAEKMEYYVAQEGFYFIALKVNAEHFAPVDWLEIEDEAEEVDVVDRGLVFPTEPDWFWGQLSPIQFTFATEEPQLPMRTLKSDIERMTFDLYTLGDQALYVPGVDTIWSNIVDAEFLEAAPSLIDYEPKGKWLLRQEVVFSPQGTDEDLVLTEGEADFVTATPDAQIRLNPSELDPDTGVVPGTTGRVVNTNDDHSGYVFNRSLTLGAVGEDVRQLQLRLNAEGFAVSDSGPGSVGNESSYFGSKTQAALIKYQNFYRAEVLEPVGLFVGTGYFGPSTIKHINGQ